MFPHDTPDAINSCCQMLLLLTVSIQHLFLACNSVKSTGQNPQAAGLPQQANNGTTMVFFGGNAQPSSAAAAAAATNLLVAVAVTTAVALSSLVL